MDVIDLAVSMPAAEALIVANVQRALRIELRASVFDAQMPLPDLRDVTLGSEEFQAVVKGAPFGPSAEPIPFYFTSINAVDATLVLRSPAQIGMDDPTSIFDNVDMPAASRLSVLVPGRGAGAVLSPNAVSLPDGALAALREASVDLLLDVMVQSQEGRDGIPVVAVTNRFRVVAVVDFKGAIIQQPVPGSATATRSAYSLRLVPKVINVHPQAGDDFVTQIRRASLPSALVLRTMIETINGILDRSAAVDLLSVVQTLAGEATFAPNAALVLSDSQLRLRVQLAREGSWFEPVPADDPDGIETARRNLEVASVVREWAEFLTRPQNLFIGVGMALALEVTPLVILQQVDGALRRAFDQSVPTRGIPKAITDLHRTLAEEGIPRTLVPLSGIGLLNDFIRIEVTAPEELGGAPHLGWGWTFSFIDACPVTEVDIDVGFRLRVHVTGAVPFGTPASRMSSTPQTDLLVSGRFDFDIDNADLARCVGPLFLTFALLVLPLLETFATPVLLGTGLPIHLLATTFGAFGLALGYDAATAAARTALQDAVMEGAPRCPERSSARRDRARFRRRRRSRLRRVVLLVARHERTPCGALPGCARRPYPFDARTGRV